MMCTTNISGHKSQGRVVRRAQKSWRRCMSINHIPLVQDWHENSLGLNSKIGLQQNVGNMGNSLPESVHKIIHVQVFISPDAEIFLVCDPPNHKSVCSGNIKISRVYSSGPGKSMLFVLSVFRSSRASCRMLNGCYKCLMLDVQNQ